MFLKIVRIQNKRKVRENYKESSEAVFKEKRITESDTIIRGKWERKEITVTSQDRNKGMKQVSYENTGKKWN